MIAAAEQPNGVAHLRPVLIIAGPRAASFESDLDSTGYSEVIDTRQAWRGYKTVGEVLEHSVGVQLRRFGAREDFAVATVRGSSAGQVKILLDGVSLSRAKNQIVNLADIPIDSVERIEVYRGFTPVRFASSGAASVINIISNQGTGSGQAASVSFGSFDTRKLSLRARRKSGVGNLAAFLTVRHTDGDFTFLDDNGTEGNSADDRRVRRRNNDRDSIDLLARYARKLPAGRVLTLRDSTFYKDEGLPGLGSNQSKRARLRALRNILTASLALRPGTAVALHLTYLDETLLDPKSPTTGDSGLGFPYPKADNQTLAATLDAHTSKAWGRFHFFEASLEGAFEQFRGSFPRSRGLADNRSDRNTLSLALGDEITLSPLHLTVSLQLRREMLWNHFDLAGILPPLSSDQVPPGHESSTDPRLGLRWQAGPDLTLRGNIGTYFRPPNFGELFGDTGFSTANAALRPETGINRDLGLLWRPSLGHRLGRAGLEYAYFNNDADDMIVFVQTGSRIAKPLNIGSSRVRGHELRLTLPAPWGLSMEANYTHQNAENRSPFPEFRGKDLPALPRDELYARIGLDRPRWRLTYEFEYRSAVFLDQFNNPVRRARATGKHHVTISFHPFASDLELRLEGRNLTNEQVVDVHGFPVPGRAWYLTVSYGKADEQAQ